MKSTIEAALAQHIRNVMIFNQIAAGPTEITFEVQHRNEGSGHYFGIRHLALCIFVMMQALEQVIAQTKNDYNLGIHEFLQSFGGRDTPTVPEIHGFLLKFESW